MPVHISEANERLRGAADALQSVPAGVDPLVGWAVATAITGLSPTTLRDRMQDDSNPFPKPIRVGSAPNSPSLFRLSWITGWMDQAEALHLEREALEGGRHQHMRKVSAAGREQRAAARRRLKGQPRDPRKRRSDQPEDA